MKFQAPAIAAMAIMRKRMEAVGLPLSVVMAVSMM